jgi:hypothetical protein
MTVHERIFVYAEILYQRALERLEAGQLHRAGVNASAAVGAAVFVEQDTATPSDLCERARGLIKAVESFMSDIWRQGTQEYGERFLSGSKKHPQDAAAKEVALFICDLRLAANEAGRA